MRYTLLLFFTWLANAVAQPIPERLLDAGSPSTIEIPFRMSLTPLLRVAEQAVPHQVGNWRNWKDWHGIKTRYRAWRGPLSIHMMGDVLLTQAHVRYWIKAQKKVLKAFDIKVNCGVNEPPRQAPVGWIAADLTVRALEAAGPDPTVEKVLAALESITDYEDPFGGPSLSFSATKHQGGDYLNLYQIRDGKWHLAASELPY